MSIYNEVANRAIDPITLDGTTNAGPTAALYTGEGGDFTVEMAGQKGVETIIAGTLPGSVLPLSIRKCTAAPVGALALMVI